MNELQQRARLLGFRAITVNWEDYANQPWLEPLIAAEEVERSKRSLERRIKEAKLGCFKLMADFDWAWPKKIDRELVEELFTLQFMQEAINVVLVGQNGLGKTVIAQNLAYQALLSGHSAKFVTASEMLNDLSAQDGASALRRCLKKYSQVDLLVIDEVGYLSYDNRYADLLYEVVTRRYQQRSTILTTNRPFKEWTEVFPNAACVTTLIDRLVHKAEIIQIEGESFRVKEARDRTSRRNKKKE